jgi:hypothetical protein
MKTPCAREAAQYDTAFSSHYFEFKISAMVKGCKVSVAKNTFSSEERAF